jgi:inward rectifier potassium channel
MAKVKNNQSDERELGFGSKNYSESVRFLRPDGQVNVKRSGMGWLNNTDIFHSLISASISKLILLIISSYILINLIFAGVYYAVGVENFGGIEIEDSSELNKYLALFFFSAQTITTLGYGHIYPIGNAASIAAAVESLLGLLSFAIATGILYGRFSRPKSDIIYSKNILISPYKDGAALMFRVSNKKQYELIESEANVLISMSDPHTNKRAFLNLKLEIAKVNFLAMSWTIVHAINEESPLFGLKKDDLILRDAEIIILIKAINDTYSQTVYSRHSYKAHELIEHAKFKALKTEATAEGAVKISVTDIHLFDLLN